MSIIDKDNALKIKQASIYLDACFLLILSDISDPRYQDIKDLVKKWGTNNNRIGISNHVYGEVVHNLFFRTILEVIYLRSQELDGYPPSTELPDRIGNKDLADKLITLAGSENTSRYVNYVNNVNARASSSNTSIYQFNKIKISTIIKKLKKDSQYQKLYRKHLNYHYQAAADSFNIIIKLLQVGYKLNFSWENSDSTLVDEARKNISYYQLDAHDAIHFAIARREKYNYIATTDRDYSSSSYVPNLKGTQIIYIA